jgi:hypothetical protein
MKLIKKKNVFKKKYFTIQRFFRSFGILIKNINISKTFLEKYVPMCCILYGDREIIDDPFIEKVSVL